MNRSLLVCAGILLLASATLSCRDRHPAQPPQSVVVVPSSTTTPQTPNGETGGTNTGINGGTTSNLVEDGNEEPIGNFRQKRDVEANYEANKTKTVVGSATVGMKAGLRGSTHHYNKHAKGEANLGASMTATAKNEDVKKHSENVKKHSDTVDGGAGGAGVGKSVKYDENAKVGASSGVNSTDNSNLSHKGFVREVFNAHEAVNEHLTRGVTAGNQAHEKFYRNAHENKDEVGSGVEIKSSKETKLEGSGKWSGKHVHVKNTVEKKVVIGTSRNGTAKEKVRSGAAAGINSKLERHPEEVGSSKATGGVVFEISKDIKSEGDGKASTYGSQVKVKKAVEPSVVPVH